MVNKLTNGDYSVQGNTVVRFDGSAAAFENALFRLQCRRGSFPFLPDLGSTLWQLGLARPDARLACARQACAQALQGSGVSAQNIRISQQDMALSVEAELVLGDASMRVEVSL